MQYPLVQKPRDRPLLVVISDVPAAREDDALLLDDKAASGLQLYCRHWPGLVRCIFCEGLRPQSCSARDTMPIAPVRGRDHPKPRRFPTCCCTTRLLCSGRATTISISRWLSSAEHSGFRWLSS